MEDLYQTLGVSKTATAEEIKKAYRNLAFKYHPDRNPGDKTAEDKFKEINAAYSVLGDETKRRQYDSYGSADAYQNAQNYGGGSANSYGQGYGGYGSSGSGSGNYSGDPFWEFFNGASNNTDDGSAKSGEYTNNGRRYTYTYTTRHTERPTRSDGFRYFGRGVLQTVLGAGGAYLFVRWFPLNIICFIAMIKGFVQILQSFKYIFATKEKNNK